MGTVVKFPEASSVADEKRAAADQPWSATVIILPVVRIERHYDVPSNGLSAGSGMSSRRKRRRRATRS